MTEAARKLYISQPALSTQLRQLESSLNERLFVKSGRKLVLTEQGKVVFSYARQLFSIADEMRDALKAAKGGGQSLRLRLGVTRQLSGRFATRLTSSFARETDPQVRQITMSVGTHAELVEMLRTKALDAVLSHRPDFSAGTTTLHEAHLPVLLLASSRLQLPGKSRQLLERNPLGFLKLFQLGFALPGPSHRLRLETDLFFEQLKISPTLAFESDDIAAVLAAVEERLGVTLVPAAYASDRIARGVIRAYGPKKGFWQHSIWLLGGLASGQSSTAAVSRLVQSLEGVNQNTG